MQKTILFCLLFSMISETQAEPTALTTDCHPDITLEVKDKLQKNDSIISPIDDTKTTVDLVNNTYNHRLKVEHQVHYIEYHTTAGTTIHVSTESDITKGKNCRRTNLKIYLLAE